MIYPFVLIVQAVLCLKKTILVKGWRVCTTAMLKLTNQMKNHIVETKVKQNPKNMLNEFVCPFPFEIMFVDINGSQSPIVFSLSNLRIV